MAFTPALGTYKTALRQRSGTASFITRTPHAVRVIRIRVSGKTNHPKFHSEKLPSLGIASIHPSHK